MIRERTPVVQKAVLSAFIPCSLFLPYLARTRNKKRSNREYRSFCSLFLAILFYLAPQRKERLAGIDHRSFRSWLSPSVLAFVGQYKKYGKVQCRERSFPSYISPCPVKQERALVCCSVWRYCLPGPSHISKFRLASQGHFLDRGSLNPLKDQENFQESCVGRRRIKAGSNLQTLLRIDASSERRTNRTMLNVSILSTLRYHLDVEAMSPGFHANFWYCQP